MYQLYSKEGPIPALQALGLNVELDAWYHEKRTQMLVGITYFSSPDGCVLGKRRLMNQNPMIKIRSRPW